MNRYKPKGWRSHSYEHGLARRGIKTKPFNLLTPKVKMISGTKYDNLPEEKERNKKGEMSYATTRIFEGKEPQIFVRATKDKEAVKTLLKHEKEEIQLFSGLEKNGFANSEALAHELNPVKIDNKQMDKAYGDIGDPL